MTSANISLEKKIFHRVENVVKQLVHTSAMRSSRYEARGKFREHLRSQRTLTRLSCSPNFPRASCFSSHTFNVEIYLYSNILRLHEKCSKVSTPWNIPCSCEDETLFAFVVWLA